MYISTDDYDGFYKNYLSHSRLPFSETLREFSANDAISLGLLPKSEGHC